MRDRSDATPWASGPCRTHGFAVARSAMIGAFGQYNGAFC